MELENKFVNFIMDGKYEDLPEEPIEVVKNIILTEAGTIVGGAIAEGCEDLINLIKEWGGKEEAIHALGRGSRAFGEAKPVHLQSSSAGRRSLDGGRYTGPGG